MDTMIVLLNNMVDCAPFDQAVLLKNMVDREWWDDRSKQSTTVIFLKKLI